MYSKTIYLILLIAGHVDSNRFHQNVSYEILCSGTPRDSSDVSIAETKPDGPQIYTRVLDGSTPASIRIFFNETPSSRPDMSYRPLSFSFGLV
mmetsp:Transcript_15272/g.37716  ORF Transcript_15272/g.37716 Transcript_15272/m.37716 type:complete len:93 (-) Transcript_15272:1299-1577(-)